MSCLYIADASRFCLPQRNLLDGSSEEMKKLTEVMLRRDPFYKPTVTPDGEHER